jgi:MFS family permease
VPFEQNFNATRAESSMTISFAWTAQFVMGLPTAWCFKRVSAPCIMLLAVLLATGGGVLAAAAATTMLEVHVLLGGMAGVGQGILWCLTCFMIPVYFPDQVGFANGIAYGLGNGLGTLAWSFGFEGMTQKYGWRRAVLLASVTSTVVLLLPLAVLLSPLSPPTVQNTVQKLTKEKGQAAATKAKVEEPSNRHRREQSTRQKNGEAQGTVDEAPLALESSTLVAPLSSTSTVATRSSMLLVDDDASATEKGHADEEDRHHHHHHHHAAASLTFLEFMATRNAVLVGLSYCSFCMAMLGGFGHLSAQVQSLGMSSDTGAIVVSVAGFTGMVSRPFGGLLADRCCGNRPLLVAASVLTSVLFLLWNMCVTPASAIFFGATFGSMFNLYYTVLAGLLWEIGGARHFNELYSVLNGLFGLPGCLFSSSLFGLAFSYHGNYWIGGFGGSALMLLAAIFPLFMRLGGRRQEQPQHGRVLVHKGGRNDVEEGHYAEASAVVL